MMSRSLLDVERRVPFALRYYVHFTYRAQSIIAGYCQDTDSFYIDLGGSIHVQEDVYFTRMYRVITYDVSAFLPPCPPPPTQPLSSANLPFTPSERYLPLTLLAPPYRERGSISTGSVPLRLIQPIPSTRERKPRTKREESAYGGASGGMWERERTIGPSRERRWCPYPHHTARRTDLDPPTRLAEGKPSRKNRPPFRGRKRTAATTLPLPPPSPSPPLDSPASFERFSRHRATTTSVILSLPPAPPALYPSPPPTTPRSTVISRNVGYSGNLQTADHACSTASEEYTRNRVIL
ncbi:hypothetical protein G5I_07029 [Acromyrmex echinatior]|uniref:Uncharacterized protein n=1 Tax=Acromyrmex echinatior TaxID=103372 RepID=F4WMP5_ACREC|nr:hypothetical protein G5I_07029 [Acromyrmex echinatior]